MKEALKKHWPEYLMEGAGIAAFMLSACLFGVILENPASPARHALPDSSVRRTLMGLAMGLTAIALIYSPWGTRSGAHLNPAVTLAFFRLHKIKRADALFYTGAQFFGAVAGVALASLLLGGLLAHPAVNFVATMPGPTGIAPAFVAELVISAGLMLTVLFVSSSRLSRLTGLFAGALVAAYIILEAPISGMSMNPARSLGSAVGARSFGAIWIYFAAPVLGMLIASELFRRLKHDPAAGCAKLNHAGPCIFCEERRRVKPDTALRSPLAGALLTEP